MTQLILVAAREAHRDPDLPEREVAGLAEALVGAAESLAAWANTTTRGHVPAVGGHPDELRLGGAGRPHERPPLVPAGRLTG